MSNGRFFALPYVLGGALAWMVLADRLALQTLVIWCSIYLLYIAARTLLTAKYHAASSELRIRLHRVWWLLSNLSGGIHGAIWAALCLVSFGYLELSRQLFLTCLIVIGGAFATAYAARTILGVQLFVAIALSGVIGSWLLFGQAHVQEVCATLLLVCFVYLHAGRAHAQALANLQALSWQNEELAAQLTSQNRNLDQKRAAQARVVAVTSHDLRQPVHSLGLLAERLDAAAPAERRMLNASIRAEVGNLSDMLTSLLDLAKLDYGEFAVRLEPVMVDEIVRRATDGLAVAAERKSLSFEVLPCGLRINTDRLLLQRSVWNLVSNAVRYTTVGGIRVSCRAIGHRLAIQVSDTGPGMSREKLAHIMTMEGPSQHVRGSAEGLGIGLSVVRQLTALLGYELEVESKVGVGTTFSMTLPLDAASGLPLQAPSQVWAATTSQGLPGGRDTRILLIEDNHMSRSSTLALLHSWGYLAIGAGDGAEVQRRMTEAGPFDLVIADLHLDVAAHVDGLMIVDALRQAQGRLPIPAIILTGETEGDRLAAARSRGITVLNKPLRPSELRLHLHKALAGPSFRSSR